MIEIEGKLGPFIFSGCGGHDGRASGPERSHHHVGAWPSF